MTARDAPDAGLVLAGLKDFQRATVEYAFQRMYLDNPVQQRFLVADEVGLGKTLVARGVIAKAVEHLWESVSRIDVVYICSNADIARQNVNRLRIPGASEFTMASRLTMLPVQVQDLKHSRLNFVSLTPGTSFDPKSKLGKAEERVLLYLLLRDDWRFQGTGPLNLFQGNMGTARFREMVREFEGEHPIDSDLADRFLAELGRQKHLEAHCRELVGRFGRSRRHIPRADDRARRELIGGLRGVLAATCVEALEPDLIILDEFQRFRTLLDGEDEAAELARSLFGWSRDHQQARVLLLSATPYKMLSLAGDADSGDHYADFMRTLRFLRNDRDVSDIDRALGQYREALYALGNGDAGRLPTIRQQLRDALGKLLARTERLAATADRDGMLLDCGPSYVDLHADDVEDYRGLHGLAEHLDQPDPVEYWKSAPYLLSFMERYELKRRVESQADSGELAGQLRLATGLSLSREDVERYAELDPRNARLRWLLRGTIDRGAWRLLWLPPAMPYYAPEGVWAAPELEGFSKRLVFSSWRVVPRMLAILTSYAAERAAVSSMGDTSHTFSGLSERLRGPLRLTLREGQPVGMPVLGIMYPSAALAALADPLEWAAVGGTPIDEIGDTIREKVSSALQRLPAVDRPGAADERWYWAAPILLDLTADPETTREFLEDEALAVRWAGMDQTEVDDEGGGWPGHLEQARNLLSGNIELGPRPHDLLHVLTSLVLAGPGITALRALGRVAAPVTLAENVVARQAAAHVAWALRNLFNLPESIALLRGTDAREPYWQRVLEYCAAGNLQSVLDEYVHVLFDARALHGQSTIRALRDLGKALRDAIGLRASNPQCDEVTTGQRRVAITPHRMRARFAVHFGAEQRDDDERHGVRGDQLRHAFNSPFWPFVLATTSIGQEGLDFHQYCHAVVHWNLPGNPVDLEQREGRVHRYKGHAIRKTLGRRYRASLASNGARDPWQHVFARAAEERNTGSDLQPYWVHGDPDGVRIERHVPVLPLSRDVLRFERLRRSLAVYRMVLGQPRQEDLIAYLTERMPLEKVQEQLDLVKIDLQPPPWTGEIGEVPRAAPPGGAVDPRGPLGRAIVMVLGRYPLVAGQRGVRADHPAAVVVRGVAELLETANLARDDRIGWEAVCFARKRWRTVPVVSMRDRRRQRRRGDDLTVELLLDCERDGVHVALVALLEADGKPIHPLQVATRYREERRKGLEPVLGTLYASGFLPVPATQFLRAGGDKVTGGVALAARFVGRGGLEDDSEAAGALRAAVGAYELAYEMKLARPAREAVRMLR